MRLKRELILILAYVFVDVLGFSLILPLLPYYADTFQASDTVVGLLLAANAVTQFLATPIIGRLSDRHGRRPLILLCLAGTVTSFALLGLARSLAMLFVSRILDGILGGNIALAQAYITDVTDDKDRAKGLGLIGAAFGMGFIFGPAIGGTLSAGGNYALPAFLAAGLAALNLLGVTIWLPESLTRERRAQTADRPARRVTAEALWAALRRPCVGPLLTLRLVYGLASTMFETIFSLFAKERLSLDARATSYVLTYVGVVIVAVQGGGIAMLTRRLRERPLIFWGSVLLAVSLLAWGLTGQLWVLLVVLAPLALSSGVVNVVSNSVLTKSVYPEETGGTLGISAAIGSLMRVVSPILGGFLIGQVGSYAPGVLGAVLMAAMALYVWRTILFVPDFECPPPRDVPVEQNTTP
jgi:DHA1 family tetracycline resistance protein-like MFS transporter